MKKKERTNVKKRKASIKSTETTAKTSGTSE